MTRLLDIPHMRRARANYVGTHQAALAAGEEQAMFSLRSNGLPCGASERSAPAIRFAQNNMTPGDRMMLDADQPARKPKGGRPRNDPLTLRSMTIGVRVSAPEYDALRNRAAHMNMSVSQWLREAAITRRLPAPPVPAINRAQYAELARLAANLNQLAHVANEGKYVTVADGLLTRMISETRQLRLSLLGVNEFSNDRQS